jgi:uncharacterized protein YbjT (DUF2867 family)
MKIFITGANGFIGGHLLAGLRARGHTVVAAVREPVALRRKQPQTEAIAVDFNRDTAVESWIPRLTGVDVVINCAGVLHGGRGQNIEAIHATTPIALFDACVAAGVRRVVQVSAISADTEVGTEYALTKKRADDHLRSLPIDWTVLRPSLVYGEGSYGGTSALRGLAGLPLISPLVGDGTMAFRPLHIEDLLETTARVIENDHFARQTLEPVGPEIVTLGQLVGRYRAWLGLAPAVAIPIPLPVMNIVARIADMAGGGPLGTMSLRQLLAGNVGHEPAGVFARAIGFTPSSQKDMLARRPAQTQDIWHARLYFVRPLLRLALVFMWLGSAAVGLLAPVASYAAVDTALTNLGLPARTVAVAFSMFDLLIAAMLLARWNARLLAVVQLVAVAGYTAVLTILAPSLWLDPFGGLLKNVPILMAICAWAALEDER